MFFDTLRRRFTYVQLHYTYLMPLRHLLTQTFNTIPFEYSTFGRFANIICIMYAAGLLPSSIQLAKKIIPDLCIQDTQKETKKIKASNKKAEIFNNSLKSRNSPQEFNNSTIVLAQTALIFLRLILKIFSTFYSRPQLEFECVPFINLKKNQ